MPELTIPFNNGQHEEIEESALPDGGLRSVKDLVMERKGRLTFRQSYDTTTPTTAHTALSDEVWSLDEFEGQRIMTVDRPPHLVYERDANSWEAPYTDVDLPPFNAAQRQFIPHELSSSSVVQADTAYANGITAVAYDLAGLVAYTIIDEATGAIIGTNAGVTGSYPKLVASEGGDIYLFYVNASDQIICSYLNTSDTTNPTFTFTMNLGTVADQAFAGCYDVCPVQGTSDIIVAYYSSGTDPTAVTVQYHTDANLSAGSATVTNTQTFNADSGTANDAALGVVSISGEFCYVGIVLTTTNEVLAATGPADASGAFSVSATPISDANARGQVGVVRASSTTALLVYNYYDTTERITGIRSATVTGSTAAIAAANDHFGLLPVSKPFVLDGRYYVVVTRDSINQSTGGARFEAHFWVVQIGADTVTTLRPCGFFGRRGAAIVISGWGLNNVATDGSGAHLWSGPVYAQGSVLSRGSGKAPAAKVGTGLWRWQDHTRDKLHMARLGRAAYLTGGIMTRWNGGALTPAGFLCRPDIVSVTGSAAGGSLVAGTTYTYACAYVAILNDGEIIRSEPSTLATNALGGGNNRNTLEIRDDPLRAFPGSVTSTLSKIETYRSLGSAAGASPYYMIHDEDTPTDGNAITTATHPEEIDISADATISINPQLYSDGTSSPVNTIPPPCRFLKRVGKRLIAGGTEHPEEVWVSQEHVTNEQVAWANEAAYIYSLPDACTAVGELDGYAVLFTRQGIFYLSGLGPDLTGTGAFELRQIPSEFGAVTHFVATCDEGLCYQSKRGIELLPRGFGPPRWIGGPVADTLGTSTITSAVNVPGDKTVRFTAGTNVLVWNPTWDFWSVFTFATAITSAAAWGDVHVIGYDTIADGRPQHESGTVGDTTDFTPIWESGDIDLQAIAGYYRGRKLLLKFRWIGGSEGVQVTSEVSRDGGQTWPSAETATWTLAADTLGDVQNLNDNDIVTLEHHLRVQKGQQMRFRVTVAGYTAAAELNYDGRIEWLGAVFEFRRKPRPTRLPAAQRS